MTFRRTIIIVYFHFLSNNFLWLNWHYASKNLLTRMRLGAATSQGNEYFSFQLHITNYIYEKIFILRQNIEFILYTFLEIIVRYGTDSKEAISTTSGNVNSFDRVISN